MRNELVNSKRKMGRKPLETIENNAQQVTDAIQSSKRPEGRLRINKIQTCSPAEHDPPIPSVITVNRPSIDYTLRPRGSPRKNPNPNISTYDIGLTTGQQDKEKIVTRQSARQINVTQNNRKVAKIAPTQGMITLIMEILRFHVNLVVHCYGMQKLFEEQLMHWTIHIQFVVVESMSFIDNIRHYNSVFAFTSMGCQIDDSVNFGHGPFCYRIHGENYHRLGSLLSGTDNTPKFAQR
ncbi:hypothetical protein Tco_1172033, partial [Tanacetum coccineum]